MRRSIPLLLLLATWLPLSSCGEDPEEQRVVNAMNETVEALRAGDWEALWRLSAPEAREAVLELRTRIEHAMAAVDEVYPPESRAEARTALGGDILEGLPEDPDEAGPKILERLLDPQALATSEGAKDGLYAGGATIDGDEAVIHTAAGEVYTFARTEDGWRSLLIRDLVEGELALRTRLENARTVLDAAEAHREVWRTARDPKSPQGAYNLVRAALERTPPDAETLYALVDDDAREVLVESLKVARDAQRIVQRESKRKEREDRYEALGIALHVKADSDRALLEAWSASDAFEPPLSTDAEPTSVTGDPETGRAEVVTKSGTRVAVVRDDEGYWHLTGYADKLGEALLAPAKEALETLTADEDED
ncbi:MAG: hypothetical protein ACQEXJ_11250 [Myxococcota bacterium]